LDGRRLETSGGRVLGVTATGASLAEAVDRVYDAAREIRFDGLHHRTDIGADTLKGMGTSGG
jgi:phosphoribosylamine--glycine ligase